MPRTAGPAHPLHLSSQRAGGWRIGGAWGHLTVRASAPVMLALVGWMVDGTALRAPLWLIGGGSALLLHEAAHAIAAGRGPVRPYIELSWRGGLTRWRPPSGLSQRRELLALGVGPWAGMCTAAVALWVAGLLPATGIGGVLAETARIHAIVAIVAAGFDLLPMFPTDTSRMLLFFLKGNPVERVERAAAIGAVVAAIGGAVSLAAGVPVLAVLLAIYVANNGWLAMRGDRAIGRPIEEAIERGDWTSVRRRIVAGCDTAELAARAQQHALDAMASEEAADIGDAALARGWHTIGFALRTAHARARLEHDDLALARIRDAVRLGATEEQVLATPGLGHLRHRADWPEMTSTDERSDDLEYVIDLTALHFEDEQAAEHDRIVLDFIAPTVKP